MKLVYLYTTGGANGDLKSYNKNNYDYLLNDTTNRYAKAALSDGMIKLFSELPCHNENIQCTEIFIDSVHSPGLIKINEHCRLYVIPSIWGVLEHLWPNSIIIVRGGFRNWLPLLKKLHNDRKHWMLYYRANTAHGHWPFWDITLNDLITKPCKGRTGIHIPFHKPVNESIFGYIDSPNQIPRDVDVMIGASHIHNKKGQYNTVKALEKFREIYGFSPKAVLPGGYIRSTNNQYIMDAVKNPELNIEWVGALPRPQLAHLMNRTKVFVHGGIGGQNDRGILEAACCGCEVVITNPKSVSPLISCVVSSIDPEELAIKIEIARIVCNPKHTAEQYLAVNGLYTNAIPHMSGVLDALVNRSVGDASALRSFL